MEVVKVRPILSKNPLKTGKIMISIKFFSVGLI